MQFIKNGPDIPERLLQFHEDGRVVFFCGAGISYPAGLPGFRGLVEKVYDFVGDTPNSIEKTAIKNGQYDTAICLFERRIAGGREKVREALFEVLKPDLSIPNATTTHEALIHLAYTRDGRHRLITTNFDRLFEEVLAKRKTDIPTYKAPLLPVPKNRWNGLVYLHGLLPKVSSHSDLDCLVVSSGDFGLAYLTERWAARFVTELFRNYTVCFVGYSINDPVLRYMMDALAADQQRGESPQEVFAFGSFKGRGKNKSEEDWCAKNVTPILYSESRNHSLLHRTLRAWGETHRDGILGKERIVSLYAMAKPVASTKQDDFVGRMRWAISDIKGLPAKRFAEFDPLPSLDWLEPFAETRYNHNDLARFGVQANTKVDDKLAFSLVNRPIPYQLAPWMALVKRDRAETCRLDEVSNQIAHWLSRHLDDKRLILWVARQGGHLHPQFEWWIFKAFEKKLPSQPMQVLWRLALSGRLHNNVSSLDFYDWYIRFKRDGLTSTLRLHLRDLLTPFVRIREKLRDFEEEEVAESDGPEQVKDLVEWEIVFSIDHLHTTLETYLKDPKWCMALPGFLSDACVLLLDVLDLMRELDCVDGYHDRSYVHQPSISNHPQNMRFHDWTALIEILRDAWLASVEKYPNQARLEAERWVHFRYPLFRRFVFFAATHSSLFSEEQSLEWLLADKHSWFWSIETQREALRLLAKISSKLDLHSRDILEQAILQGPPRDMFKKDINTDNLQRTIDRDVWLRLALCRQSGMTFSTKAEAEFYKFSQKYPVWHLAEDQSDEFPIWMGGGENWRKSLATPKSCRDLVNWLREHPHTDTWQDDDWRERCLRDFRRTATVLLHLAKKGEWITDRWREALQAWSDEALLQRSWNFIGGSLTEAPDEVVKELGHSLGWWLQSAAKEINKNEIAFFEIIQKILSVHRDEVMESDDDPVGTAINHPIGFITEASLRWWYRQSLEDGLGLNALLNPIFTELCNTSISIFRHGRVLLATHVITIFRVDREWTIINLLPIFDWQSSEVEARAAWAGYLGSPRIYPPLMEIFKSQFLDTAKHYVNLGKYGEQYAALLTYVSLEPGDIFNKSELAVATRSLPAEGLKSVVRALVNALEGTTQHRAEYWRNRVLPYLKSIWPKSNRIITPSISGNFARLCIAAQDAFPDALQELRHWLNPPEFPDFLVHLLHEAKLCKQYPKESLAFLDIIIASQVGSPQYLQNCLNTIREARQDLDIDTRFQRLSEYLLLHTRG